MRTFQILTALFDLLRAIGELAVFLINNWPGWIS
jgi:hypothetical protein